MRPLHRPPSLNDGDPDPWRRRLVLLTECQEDGRGWSQLTHGRVWVPPSRPGAAAAAAAALAAQRLSIFADAAEAALPPFLLTGGRTRLEDGGKYGDANEMELLGPAMMTSAEADRAALLAAMTRIKMRMPSVRGGELAIMARDRRRVSYHGEDKDLVHRDGQEYAAAGAAAYDDTELVDQDAISNFDEKEGWDVCNDDENKTQVGFGPHEGSGRGSAPQSRRVSTASPVLSSAVESAGTTTTETPEDESEEGYDESQDCSNSSGRRGDAGSSKSADANADAVHPPTPPPSSSLILGPSLPMTQDQGAEGAPRIITNPLIEEYLRCNVLPSSEALAAMDPTVVSDFLTYLARRGDTRLLPLLATMDGAAGASASDLSVEVALLRACRLRELERRRSAAEYALRGALPVPQGGGAGPPPPAVRRGPELADLASAAAAAAPAVIRRESLHLAAPSDLAGINGGPLPLPRVPPRARRQPIRRGSDLGDLASAAAAAAPLPPVGPAPPHAKEEGGQVSREFHPPPPPSHYRPRGDPAIHPTTRIGHPYAAPPPNSAPNPPRHNQEGQDDNDRANINDDLQTTTGVKRSPPSTAKGAAGGQDKFRKKQKQSASRQIPRGLSDVTAEGGLGHIQNNNAARPKRPTSPIVHQRPFSEKDMAGRSKGKNKRTSKYVPRTLVVHKPYRDWSDELPTPEESRVAPCFSAPRGGCATVFPARLHAVLDLLERERRSPSVASWRSHGRAFMIHNPEAFVDYWPTAVVRTGCAQGGGNNMKYSSFQRQLNLYGFLRISAGTDKGSYYHPMFLRGRFYLAHRIPRLRLKGNRCRAGNNPDEEPDFYAMNPVGPPPGAALGPPPPLLPPMSIQDAASHSARGRARPDAAPRGLPPPGTHNEALLPHDAMKVGCKV
uniref:HSF-type DNA-binding domain-containing protein n=1 Tax=Pseudictyota dubia TaxID=2749911 RepID=A0A7R9WDE8_9STRA